MSIETKRREILQMLANGSITAAEAGDLLLQIKDEEAEAAAAPAPAPEPGEPVAVEPAPESIARRPGKKARWLNIRVTDTDSGRDRVSVRIPLSLARFGIRMGARFAPEIEGVDWDEALQELGDGGEQTLIEVNDENDGEHVHIFVS